MISITSGSTMSYLASLERTTNLITETQSAISSGYRVTQASDDPSVLEEILQLQTTIAQNTQIQSNLDTASTELSSADTALSSALDVLQRAETLASQGASSTGLTSSDYQALATEALSLQKELVSLSQTQVSGRYIFSGDQDSSAQYEYDSTATYGVTQEFTTTATRTITDASGTQISIALTAQDIFDPQDSTGTPTTSSAFAAMQELVTALQNSDQSAAETALANLKSAYAYVNDKLTYYGTAETRVSESLTLAEKFQTQEKSDLSNLRDTDEATAAVTLSQTEVTQEAALAAEAKVLNMKNIFDYIA